MGISFYIGDTGSGKTTLAEAHAATQAAIRGVPLVVIDSEGVLSHPDALRIPAPESKEEEDDGIRVLVSSVWNEGKHVSYVPRDDEDAGRVFEAVRAGGNVVLLIDEASYWARGVSILPQLLRLSRVNRLVGVDLYLTTQYPADLNPLLWNVKREVFVFRNGGEAALERLGDELRLDEDILEIIRELPDHEFFKWPIQKITGKPSLARQAPPAPGTTPAPAAPASSSQAPQPDE
jgi:hypothetical protein